MPETSLPPLASFAEANREIVRALRDDDPEIRAAALEEAAQVLDDELLGEILRLARDPEGDEEERADALIALGPALEMCYIEEDEDGRLPEATGDDFYDEVWRDAPLSDGAYREATEGLRALYLDGGQPKLLRRRALEAAVRAPRPWQREAAAAAWSSDDGEWRVTATFAMGFLSDFDEEIREAFASDDPEIRGEAIRAAAHADIEALAPEILAIAADRAAPTPLRLAAIYAVGELAPDGTAELLEDLAEGGPGEIAEAAEAALEEMELMSPFDEEEDWEGLDALDGDEP